MVLHPTQQPSFAVRDSQLVAHPAHSATEQGEVNAGNSENIIEVDESPLPRVEVDDQDERLDYEVVISRTNKEVVAINSQISADKPNGISRYEQRKDSESREAFKEIVTEKSTSKVIGDVRFLCFARRKD